VRREPIIEELPMPNPAGAVHPDTITIGGDLTVARLGFGAMRVCGRGAWGDPPDRKAAIALLRRVVERSVTLIDTADSYGPGTSESLIAEALHPYPAGVVIATKGGLLRPTAARWDPDCRPAHLREACEASLRRLKIERIDLYQLHTVDPRVKLADSLGALVELQRQGKIRHIGLSNVSVAQLNEARKLATIVSVQNRYNLEDRDSDPVIDACAAAGIAFLPWYPLAAGSLAQARTLDRVAARYRVAGKAAAPAQIALAWLLQRSPVMAPIPGTGSVEHLEENLGAREIALADADFAALANA
jgi:aryl-alcohol dehydrogenase-like predicted oxidoreductase